MLRIPVAILFALENKVRSSQHDDLHHTVCTWCDRSSVPCVTVWLGGRSGGCTSARITSQTPPRTGCHRPCRTVGLSFNDRRSSIVGGRLLIGVHRSFVFIRSKVFRFDGRRLPIVGGRLSIGGHRISRGSSSNEERPSFLYPSLLPES